MASIYGGEDRPAEELTARTRIRDAALAQFAEHGYAGATMRSIAEAAGVSVGLVQHHFGTKAGLRQACHDTVVALVRRKLGAAAEGQAGSPELVAALYQSGGPALLAYLARALVEGSPAASALFDELVDGVEGFLSAQWPERFPAGAERTRAAAAAMGAMSAGALVLHPLVARRLGLEEWRDLLAPQLNVAMLDVYLAMGEYVASAVGADVEAAVAQALGGAQARAGEEGEGDG